MNVFQVGPINRQRRVTKGGAQLGWTSLQVGQMNRQRRKTKGEREISKVGRLSNLDRWTDGEERQRKKDIRSRQEEKKTDQRSQNCRFLLCGSTGRGWVVVISKIGEENKSWMEVELVEDILNVKNKIQAGSFARMFYNVRLTFTKNCSGEI